MPNFEHPEYPEATLLHLESMVPCRESQVSSLLSVFGKRQHFSFPSIFIYGHTSSGKTYVIQTVLETLELPHLFVNCIECFTSRLLLEEILTQLQNLSSEKKHGSRVPCDTFNDFVRLFKQETITQDLQNQTVYIVLDKAEQLREMEANVLPGFLRLQEFAALNFTKYCEPVVRGEASERDTRRLWKNIESHLKKAMQTVYLREISSSQWEKIQQDDGEPGHLKGLSAHAHVELPYYSKFLLIAAYLASYNPARTDKRFFLKHHGKIKKTNFLKKHEKTSNHLLGPKPFPLDRLLAILYSIVDNKVAPTANIFSQITSLVTLQLLTLVGHDDQLDGPKYKCTVSLDFIRAIARTVNFDIIKYLYDFL
nr:origin recognition complex subunit 5 isoform X3 [Pelodiscus sinensis]|eukprot:XP_025034497.1 origin recognition complex subunit 5 isoform X3 [Pelodiscus sinensis]